MDCYLDINGVLINQDQKPANHVTEFLKYLTEHCSCFWLTSQCNNGDRTACIEYLRPILPAQSMWYVEKILPTAWKRRKTEAIIWKRPFFWFDDQLSETDERELIKHHELGSHILVDLEENPDGLQKILGQLQVQELLEIIGMADRSVPAHFNADKTRTSRCTPVQSFSLPGNPIPKDDEHELVNIVWHDVDQFFAGDTTIPQQQLMQSVRFGEDAAAIAYLMEANRYLGTNPEIVRALFDVNIPKASPVLLEDPRLQEYIEHCMTKGRRLFLGESKTRPV